MPYPSPELYPMEEGLYPGTVGDIFVNPDAPRPLTASVNGHDSQDPPWIYTITVEEGDVEVDAPDDPIIIQQLEEVWTTSDTGEIIRAFSRTPF